MKRMGTALTVLSLVWAAWSTADAGIKKGPYIQQLGKNGVTIVWETESDSGGTLEYGPGDMLTQKIEAQAGSMHEVRLEGLETNTAYTYKVTSDGEETEPVVFWTAIPASEPFRFIAYGDSRSNYLDHQKVINAMVRESPDIYMNTGDLVRTGTDAEGWQEHFDIEKELMATTPLLPTIGNHDTNSGNCDLYKEYFSLPKLSRDEENHFDEHYYFQDYGNTRFIGLDDQVASLAVGSPQQEWLMAVLQDASENPEILHIFIGLHVGPYTAKSGRSGNANLRAIMDQLKAYNVTAIISGHDHHYYRGEAANGLNFIVSGGGGAGLYECEPREEHGVFNHMCEEVNHYVVFDINGPNISATAKTYDGRILETFEWVSSKQVVSNGDGSDANPDSGSNDDELPGSSATSETYDPEYGFGGCQATGGGAAVSLVIAASLIGFGVLRRRRVVR